MKRGKLLFAVLAASAASRAFAQPYTFTTLTSFNGSNGASPKAGLTLSGNTLYGTTEDGGAASDGTVFSIAVNGGSPTVLASFNHTNGAGPIAGLTLSGNTLYGTARVGGVNGAGTVFSLPITGGTPSTLASFNASSTGDGPCSNLTLSGNNLYGTTTYDGPGGMGTVFAVPVGGGTPTVLASFSGSNGATPNAGLTLSGSTLYGTASYGASGYSSGNEFSGFGTVFSVPVTGSSPTTLATFNGSNGGSPFGGLTLVGSTLYGTTTDSGGTVFSMPVGGGAITTLASFNDSNGWEPEAGLIDLNGMLYGTTEGGGSGGDGTVFCVPIGGSALTTLMSFNGSNGFEPEAGLIADAAGNLYGTTLGGGTYGDGTVFELSPAAIPEPASLSLIGCAAVGLLGRRRRRS